MTRRWMVGSAVLGLVLGLAGGIGGYTFIYAKGASYLSNDAAVCANCHIMKEHYDGWIHGSHRTAAVCNDCHTPPGLVPKYATKASNGFWHSFAFTTGRFPDPLRIKERNYEVTQRACRKCHQEIVDAIDRVAGEHGGEEALDCIRCHRNVGHDV